MMLTSDKQSEESHGRIEIKADSPVRFFDGLFVLRPTLMFPLWTMLLVGYLLADRSPGLDLLQWVLLSISISSIFGLIYLLNQLRDRETDKHNRKLLLVSGEILSNRFLAVEVFILVIVAAVFLVASGFAHLGLMAVIGLGIGGVLYNFTPLAFQKRAFSGILSGAVGGWLLCVGGGMIAGAQAPWWKVLPYVVAFASGCLMTNVLDREGDIIQGKKTFTVIYGVKRTIQVTLAGYLVVCLLGILNNDPVITVPAAIASVVMIIATIRDSAGLAVSANKLAILLLSLSVGFYFPTYLIIIVVYFIFARWYHRCRFNLDYPNLGAE